MTIENVKKVLEGYEKEQLLEYKAQIEANLLRNPHSVGNKARLVLVEEILGKEKVKKSK